MTKRRGSSAGWRSGSSNKAAATQARTKAGGDRVPNPKPSHALADNVGDYENPVYGVLKVKLKGTELRFDFHKIKRDPGGEVTLPKVSREREAL